eukprot:2706657-Rhodomonas_salina.1
MTVLTVVTIERLRLHQCRRLARAGVGCHRSVHRPGPLRASGPDRDSEAAAQPGIRHTVTACGRGGHCQASACVTRTLKCHWQCAF